MLRQKLLSIFDAAWLPALLVASTTWLYGPWLHHAHTGHLAVISTYEASGMPLSLLFRSASMLGALLIMAVVWRSELVRRERWLGRVLLVVAALFVVDAIFTGGCQQHCATTALVSLRIHDAASIVSVVTLVVATAIDGYRHKTLPSRLFLVAQLVIGGLLLVPFASRQYRIASEYLYQVLVIAWIATVLRRFTTRSSRPVPAALMRSGFATAVFIAGLIELILAFHVRAYGRIPGALRLQGESVWLAEHSVVVGVVMLYMSRFIYKGERRAAIIIGVVVSTMLIKYALLTPNAYLLAFGQLLLLGLWVGWAAFDRNTGVPPLLSKVKSLAVMLFGVIAALGLLVGLTLTTGQGRDLAQDSRHLFGASAVRFESASDHENRAQYRLSHIRYVSTGLAVSLLSITLWSLFRPAGRKKLPSTLSTPRARELLDAYATSSEDYFKLWPADKTYFTVPSISGFIAYKKVSTMVFALADPVCAPLDRQPLLQAFLEFCRAHGWSLCFLLIDETSTQLYRAANLNILNIGSSAMVPIRRFNESTVKDKWWRWQLNRAAKAGLRYETALAPHSPELLRETATLSKSWLTRAGHGEQGFALGFYDERYLQRCSLHLLRDEAGALVAFANQLPVFNGLRQATVDLIRFRPDVSGAMPVLIARILDHLGQAADYDTFDLGFVPLAKVDTRVASIARRLVATRFSAAGLEQFKGKFKPDWQPQYLAYDGDLLDLAVLLGRLQKAMNVESPE